MSPPAQKEVSTKPDAASLEQRAIGGEDLQKELAAISPQDRLALAKEMDTLNAERRKNDPSIPDLVLETQKGQSNDEYLAGIEVKKPSEKAGNDGDKKQMAYTDLAVSTFNKLDHGDLTERKPLGKDSNGRDVEFSAEKVSNGFVNQLEANDGYYNNMILKDSSGGSTEKLNLTKSEAALRDVMGGTSNYMMKEDPGDMDRTLTPGQAKNRGLSLGDMVGIVEHHRKHDPSRLDKGNDPAPERKR